MIVCYRCQQVLGERNRKVKVKDGIMTTTYCRHCYKAIKGNPRHLKNGQKKRI